MLAIALTLRQIESAYWLQLVRERFQRFDRVRLAPNRVVVLVPEVGPVLMEDEGSSIRLDAIAPDEEALSAARSILTEHVAQAAPDRLGRRRLGMTWEWPSVIPAVLRS